MRFVKYLVADKGWRAGVNRLGGKTIGAYVVLGAYCYSWVWRKP